MDKISFKKWAFKFIIWIFIMNVVAFFINVNQLQFSETGLIVFGSLSFIILMLSFIFIVISSIKKEKRNYEYWISVIGISLFGILPLFINFL